MGIFLIAFYILIIVAVTYFSLRSTSVCGKIGEAGCAAILNMLPKDKYIVINDLLIKNSHGSTSQVDHVVLSIYGIFVIETKNYSGRIYGNDKAENWIKNVYGHKYSFYNPVKQNYGHIKAVKRCLGLSSDYGINGIVAFTNRADLRVHSSYNVVNFGRLLKCIKHYKNQCFDSDVISSYAEKLESFTGYSREEKRDHIREVRAGV